MPEKTRDRQSIVPARPSVLRWAREAARYSQAEAAALLGITPTQLFSIEKGERQVESTLFRRMMAVYMQVESVLLLPEPPEEAAMPHDYRTVGTAPATLSRETLSVIREARRLQDYLTDLVADEPELLPATDVPRSSFSQSPVDVADSERRRFGVDMVTQSAWQSQQAFEEWRGLVQKRGCIVLLEKMPWEDCRGLSLWDGDAVPVIVVNSEDAATARCFTMFHEYAHLVLRRSGICIAEPSQTIKGQVERWCNAFAANVLVPRLDLLAAVRSGFEHLGRDNWTIADIRRLAAKFRVSPYVMARRLKELSISSFYDTHIGELRRFDRRARRAGPPGPRVKTEVMRLAQLGTGAAFVVLDAWKAAVIDAGEAADILRLRTDQLGGFEERAEAKRRRIA